MRGANLTSLELREGEIEQKMKLNHTKIKLIFYKRPNKVLIKC